MKTKHLFRFLSAVILLLLYCNAVISQSQQQDSVHSLNKEMSIPAVVVTGQYAARKPEDAVQKIRVIDNKKIAAMGAQNIRDVLLNEMNVRISQDNILGSSVEVQGISGQNVKLLIDGVPVIGRQGGNIDLSQLNVYNVERIEIIEGPMSVNYGTDAMAGTINIITKSSQKNKWEAGLNTYYESIGKYNINANAGYHTGKHTVLLTGSRNFFDGWNEGEKIKFADFSPKPADVNRAQLWDPKEEYNTSLQYIYRTSATSLRYKLDYFHDIIANRGAPDSPYLETAFDEVYKTYRFNNAVFGSHALKNNKKFDFLAAYNFYKRIKRSYEHDLTTLVETPAAPQDQDTSKYSLFNSRATFSSDKKGSGVSYEVGYDINIENGTGLRVRGHQQQIGDYAAYGSLEYTLVKGIIVRPGLRYAYNTAYASPLVPSINIRYQVCKNVALRASYARGFRAPTVKELYFEFKDSNHDIVGNPDLKSENGDNFNMSAGYSNEIGKCRYKIDVSGFYNNINNMISLAQPDTTILRYTYVNIDKYKTHGVQLNFNVEYKHIQFSIGGSYIGRYNQLDGMLSTPAYSYSPELRSNLIYELKKQGITASIFFKYTGRLQGYTLATNEKNEQVVALTSIQDYSIADVSVSKFLFKRRVNIAFGSKNIFNVTTVTQTGPVQGTSGSPHSGTIGSMPLSTGRSYFIAMGFIFSR